MPNAAHKPLYSIIAQKSQRDLECVVGAKRKIENKLAAKVGIDRLRNRRPCQRVSRTQKSLEHAFVAAGRSTCRYHAFHSISAACDLHIVDEGRHGGILGVIELRLHLTAAEQCDVESQPIII